MKTVDLVKKLPLQVTKGASLQTKQWLNSLSFSDQCTSQVMIWRDVTLLWAMPLSQWASGKFYSYCKKICFRVGHVGDKKYRVPGFILESDVIYFRLF